MKLVELTRPQTRFDAHDILINAGYSKVGDGNWSQVYRKANESYVLKLFSSTDYAYLAFLALVKNHPNIHFPTVIGKLIKVTENYYAVRLEPLENVNSTADQFVKVARDYIRGIDLNEFIDGVRMIDADNPHWQDIIKARDFMENHSEIKKACDLIGTLLPRFRLDMHRDNVMLRNTTFVFTDPIYDRNST